MCNTSVHERSRCWRPSSSDCSQGIVANTHISLGTRSWNRSWTASATALEFFKGRAVRNTLTYDRCSEWLPNAENSGRAWCRKKGGLMPSAGGLILLPNWGAQQVHHDTNFASLRRHIRLKDLAERVWSEKLSCFKIEKFLKILKSFSDWKMNWKMHIKVE